MAPPQESHRALTKPSLTVVEAVAAREGIAPEDFEPPAYEPLYNVIDPEALDRLLDSGASSAYVTFTYCGYEVTVHGDRTVEIDDEGVTEQENSK